MKMIYSLAAALVLGLATLAGPVSAQEGSNIGMFPGLPVVDQLTGEEAIPADSNYPAGAPATVSIPTGVLGGAGLIPETRYPVIPIGSVAYSSLGTSTTPVAGTQYFAEIPIPINFTISAIACLNGGTAATDLLIYGLWDTDGTLLANTSLSGTLAANANTFQSINLTASETVTAGTYYVGWQTNGTTTRVRTIAASTYIQTWTHSDTGSFATLESQTFPGTFTADVGPICYVSGAQAS